jgi:adenylosuccinate lyase
LTRGVYARRPLGTGFGMTEPVKGLIDPEIALQRQTDTLVQRFPDVERAQLERLVRDTYARLKDEAAVEDHLVAMTVKQVTEHLRDQGEEVHMRSDTAE